MESFVAMFERYGLVFVFGAVLLEQLGPPLPSGPLLMIAGALADQGHTSALSIAATAWSASMLGKAVLYVIGLRYGSLAMTTLCRLAVTADSTAGKADRRLERWGPVLLVLAEFIPGVRTLAPSLAGARRLSPTSFWLYSTLGAVLWTGFYLGVGLLFSRQIDRALALVEQSGKTAAVVIAVALVYIAIRWLKRRIQ
jgi:membrane protein DedA with SNARE-associated domain